MDKNEMHAINYKILWKDFIIINMVSLGAVLIVFGVMLFQRYDILPPFPCGIHEMFHIYCPGCGGTRALFALLQGKLLQSLLCNPAILLGLMLVLYYETGVIVTLIKRNGKHYYYQKGWLLYGYLMIVVLFTIIRNWLLLGFRYDMLKDFL